MFPPDVGNENCATALVGPTGCPAGKFYTQKHCKACSADLVANRVSNGETSWLCECVATAETLIVATCTACTSPCLTCSGAATTCTSCDDKTKKGAA